MQLTIPDCCLGEFCPGVHAEGHREREDGTQYSTDDLQGKAFHYHNTDGSVFYRYPDGSEYYRRKNGNIQFRPPPNLSEKVEPGTDVPGTPVPTSVSSARAWRPWYDWPPQLNLSVGASGSSITIRDESGSTITFEPVGTSAKGDGVVSARDSALPSARVQLNKGSSPRTQSVSFVQEWVKKQALADILSASQNKDLGGVGSDIYAVVAPGSG